MERGILQNNNTNHSNNNSNDNGNNNSKINSQQFVQKTTTRTNNIATSNNNDNNNNNSNINRDIKTTMSGTSRSATLTCICPSFCRPPPRTARIAIGQQGHLPVFLPPAPYLADLQSDSKDWHLPVFMLSAP